MKRWAGLLTLLLLAAIGAVAISTRLQPSELERRHATIRVGMTRDEVVELMGTGQADPRRLLQPVVFWTWSWLPPRRFMARDVLLQVEFDATGRVARTSVDGMQLQPEATP